MGITVIEIDLEKQQVLTSNVMYNLECNSVFSDCLNVRLNKDSIDILATSNEQEAENHFKRKVISVKIPFTQ